VFDAGAGKADADIRALWDLADEHPQLTVTVRTCRYPHRLRQWKQLPSDLFVPYEAPGACVGAPPKEIRLGNKSPAITPDNVLGRKLARIAWAGVNRGKRQGPQRPL
jgi:hypothetical protein